MAFNYKFTEGEQVLKWTEVVQIMALSKWLVANTAAGSGVTRY